MVQTLKGTFDEKLKQVDEMPDQDGYDTIDFLFVNSCQGINYLRHQIGTKEELSKEGTKEILDSIFGNLFDLQIFFHGCLLQSTRNKEILEGLHKKG